MLKLTHSFCRYTRIQCENINYSTFVENLTDLSCRGTTRVLRNSLQLLSSIVPTSSQSSRLVLNIKKKIKKSHANVNTTKKHKIMSNTTNPSVENICYGGQFDISSEDDTSSERHSDSEENKEPTCNIPTDFRIWEPVGRRSVCGEGFRFRVVSYNVLAQYLLECHPYLYTECGLRNLKWKIRAARIYDEILSLSPDIFCLQEVQVSHLNSFYKKFEEMGYFGVFKQKTGQRQDGCAIYFKKSLFEMKDHVSYQKSECMVFQAKGKALPSTVPPIKLYGTPLKRVFQFKYLGHVVFFVQKDGADIERAQGIVEFYQPEVPILNRDNIGLIVKLAPNCSPDTPIVVATTHLLYNPNRTDVRLAQLQVLLAEIDRFAYNHDGKDSTYLPIILAGDLNSTPDSAVVDLLDRGAVSALPFRDNSDWKKIGVTDKCQHLSVYLNRKRGVATDFSMIKINNSDYTAAPADVSIDTGKYKKLFNGGVLSHPLNLKSVYHRVKINGHMEATTFQDYWVTVDYIYFSGRNSLKLVERLRLPTVTECKVLGKLPNYRFGSDHLALGATFELKHAKSSL